MFFINQSQQNKYQISSESIFSVNEESIFQISLHDSNGDSLVLIKTDTSWTMPQADTLEIRDRQIDQFFEKVVSGTYDMVMSKNPEKWEKFGVTDSLGKTVNLFDENGALLSSVIISNKGQDYSHNFYRVASENEVYRTTENIFYMINVRPDYWGSKPKPEKPLETSTPVPQLDPSKPE